MIVDGEELQPSDFPATFSWEEGSTHTLSLSKPILDQGNGTRRVLLKWSDGFPEPVREFTVGPSTTLNAVFKTQYFVQVSGPSEAGSLPGHGWRDVAEIVELSTSRELSGTEPLTRQIFDSWIIDGKLNQENPISLQVKGPHDIVASYVLQHFVAVRSDYGSPQGSGWYEAGSVATISIESTTDVENGTRRAFAGWRGDFPGNQPTTLVTVDAPKIIEAQWLIEYFVDVDSSYGNSVGSGWKLADSVVEISLPEIVEQGNDTRRIFDHWNGDSTLTTHKINLKVDSPKFLSATWKTEYFVEVEANEGQIRGGGWHTLGDLTTIEAITPSTLVPGQTRLIFLGWSGDVEESTQKLVVTISSPLNLHANWRPQHYLTVSSEGSVDTASKWIDEGQTVTVTAQSISNEKPRESRLLFELWQGSAISDGSEITLRMNEPKKLEAIWKEQFFFSIHSNFGEPTGEGWYDKGSFATATINSPTGLLVKQVFTGWNGDLVSNNRHIMIEMDSPKSVTAKWTTDLTELLLIFSVVAIAAGITFVLFKRRADSK